MIAKYLLTDLLSINYHYCPYFSIKLTIRSVILKSILR